MLTLPRVQMPRLRGALPVRLPTTTAGRVVLAAYVGALVLLVALVSRHCSRVPYHDEYCNFDLLFDNPGAAAYWRQHNEHRVLLPRLVYVASVSLTGYDFRAPLVVNAALLAGVAAYLLAVVRRLRGRFAITDAAIPLLVLSIAQYENLLWGFQLQFILSTTLALLFLGLAVQPGFGSSVGRLAAGGLIAALLPLCGANGIPFALSLGVLLLILGARNLRFGARLAGWVAVLGGLLAVGLVPAYFIGLQKLGGSAGSELTEQAVAFLNLFGFGFGQASYLVHGEAYHGLTVAGLLTTLFLAWTGLKLVRIVARPGVERDRALAVGALLGGVVGLAVGVAYGRATGWYAPRYVSLFVPGPVIAYFAWVAFVRQPAGRWGQTALLAAALLALVPNAVFANRIAAINAERLKRVEYEIKSGVPVGIIADRNPCLYPGYAEGRRAWLEMLRARGIAPFHRMTLDPQYAAELVPLRVIRTEGLAEEAGEYRVTAHEGAVLLALPRREHVHAVRLTYTASRPGMGLPVSFVSWDRGGHFPPAPGYGWINVIDRRATPEATVLRIDREIDTFRIDLFETDTTIRIISLELLRMVE